MTNDQSFERGVRVVIDGMRQARIADRDDELWAVIEFEEEMKEREKLTARE